jgi:hypothetical protein
VRNAIGNKNKQEDNMFTSTTPTIISSPFELQSLTPIYGEKGNYNKGYIGFTYNNNNIISRGIAYFTRWEKMGDISATHALIVTGENECIEALMGEGVVKAPLDKYFDDIHCQIFFRKPVDLNHVIADKITALALKEEGKKYESDLIPLQAFMGTVAGHFLNKHFQGKLEEALAKKLDHPDRWICSELASYCLDEQPQYKDRGILLSSNATISPQELFEDEVIFTPWHDSKSEGL